MTAVRALLAGIVDYAGLFPPAALDMPAAVRNYAAYRADERAWMLGRFVVPVARLSEFLEALSALGKSERPEWRLSALAGANAVDDIDTAKQFNAEHQGEAHIDAIEARLATPDAIAAAASAARGAMELFAEVPIDTDPAPLIAAIHTAGIEAKVRTGGVTSDAIPPTSHLVRFLRRCIDAGVRFKATAGLHHPLRAEYPLTYDSAAPVGLMFGYLNVFLAAAFMRAGMSDADAERLLEERSAGAFTVTSAEIRWNGRTISAPDIRRARAGLAASFGSCSFREPVDDLRAIALII